MELLPNCYTDLCVNGKWFHYDHGESSVFMLNGSEPLTFELERQPATEEELEQRLTQIAQLL
ncbi:hypothetical protein [Shewanella psychrotolerans]|uniref:hypothetical protein n=1 Tax=Shewanella psychrotolerans TaxID=2864206 RepID=UPI001C65FED7|nr:hypothetical protein [Shewanella psychrotolerans]QYK02385.1 hypothetical protein K0I62_05370 [Shewanella psychrotolerans]